MWNSSISAIDRAILVGSPSSTSGVTSMACRKFLAALLALMALASVGLGQEKAGLEGRRFMSWFRLTHYTSETYLYSFSKKQDGGLTVTVDRLEGRDRIQFDDVTYEDGKAVIKKD